MTLKELCEAYRNGHRWYIFDGSREATAKTRSLAFAEVDMKPVNDVPNGTCWQLVREIAYRLTGSEPMDPAVPIQNMIQLDDCTGADLLVISKAIQLVHKYYSGK